MVQRTEREQPETARLTCSNHSLNLNARRVQLLGKLMDSPVRVLVGFRVNVCFGAWKFNCRRVRGLLLRLNMHAAQCGPDSCTIAQGRWSEGITEQFDDGKYVSKGLPDTATKSIYFPHNKRRENIHLKAWLSIPISTKALLATGKYRLQKRIMANSCTMQVFISYIS